MDTKHDVQKQFGRSADSYVSSAIHAKGEDLQKLLAMANLTGAENMLDVATGAGHTANAFAPFVKQVTAFDLTPEMLSTAEKFLKKNSHENAAFVQGDAEKMPFANAEFDLITCRIAPHHFPNVENFVSEVHRVLKTGGQFLLDDNTAPEEDDVDHFYNTVEKRRDYSHHHALKKTEWLRMLELQGFEIEEAHRFTKVFEFEDWTGRMQLPANEKAELNDYILHASEKIKRKLRIQTNRSQVLSFQAESLLVKVIKPF